MKETKVMIVQPMSGHSFDWVVGDVVQLPDGEAQRMVASGVASLARKNAKVDWQEKDGLIVLVDGSQKQSKFLSHVCG